MFSKTKIALVAALTLGSVSLALADDYTDQAADALRSYGPVATQQVSQPQFSTRHVALPQGRSFKADEQWMDRASQTESGGGY